MNTIKQTLERLLFIMKKKEKLFIINYQKRLKKVFCSLDIYLLLTEFEGRTVSYGPRFFLLDLWPKREAREP